MEGSRVRAFIGIGSNMGDRMALIRRAVAGLPDVVGVSPVYETEPVGGPPGQDPYLNVVVELLTEMSPRQLLELGRRLESEADRKREVSRRAAHPRRGHPARGRRVGGRARSAGAPSPHVGETIRPRPSGGPGS